MSGRRLRTAVRNALVNNGFSADARVVIAGLSNTYASYIATYEEYQVELSPAISKQVTHVSPPLESAL